VSTDYHLHTPLCHHAVGHPREYVAQAQKRGLHEIGFADHNPMPTLYDNWRMSRDELPRYLELVADARETGFPVRLGLECDYISGYEGWIEELSGCCAWDYLIGSVHYLGQGWEVDNPKLVHKFEEVPVDQIWELYWTSYLRCIRSGLFDFVAHPDLPKKFGHRPKADPRPAYEKVIQALGDHNVAFELNTAGWRKEVREQYPAFEFLRLAGSAGVPVLVNSDAHAPEEVGANFAEACQLLRDAGYQEVVTFQGRRRLSAPL
jgi:histidinol-phosphatase (PHP family)